MTPTYNFHIPVMGIAYTIDTPIKVAHFGITSVLSLGDDMLLERLREHYCKIFQLDYLQITRKEADSRAKRITAYLNMINHIVSEKFQNLKNSVFDKSSEITKYFEMLPDFSSLKKEYLKMVNEKEFSIKENIQNWLRNHITVGSIDVNIMTKLDRTNYSLKGEAYSIEFNDAHAALRGFANSNLNSSLVLSAGLNPRLYSYIANFDTFFPNEKKELEKKIILKVSDYRSAIVQGKMLAKKGIWVSEYRIESGLNCGGHAFISDGHTMGPILEEFKRNRQELIDTTHDLLNNALKNLGKPTLDTPLEMKLSAQGGVGTYEEHRFLTEYYNIDSVGWGTPFLLVPEVVNIDKETLELLMKAKEDDVYLSGISPIGVPFNTVKGNSKDIQRLERIKKGRPGSPCPSQYLKLFNTEFTDTPICEASHQYQKLKIKQLDEKNITDKNEYQKQYDKITEKTCLCTGLVRTAYTQLGIDKRSDDEGVSICPGPNIAYYSKQSTLAEMIAHIHGKNNILDDSYRPNMYIKEFGMYVNYLQKEVKDCLISEINEKKIKYFNTFKENLLRGIEYYQNTLHYLDNKTNWKQELIDFKKSLNDLKIPTLILNPVN